MNSKLPPELWALILGQVDVHSLAVFRSCSKSCRELHDGNAHDIYRIVAANAGYLDETTAGDGMLQSPPARCLFVTPDLKDLASTRMLADV